MSIVTIEIGALQSDPDIDVNGILTIERSDGRSVWRQRIVITKRYKNHLETHYVAEAIDDR